MRGTCILELALAEQTSDVFLLNNQQLLISTKLNDDDPKPTTMVIKVLRLLVRCITTYVPSHNYVLFRKTSFDDLINSACIPSTEKLDVLIISLD